MMKRIFISSATNVNLTDCRRTLKAAIIERIENAGYEPQEFSQSGLPANLCWTFENVRNVMRSCVGAVIFGFPRWTLSPFIGSDTKFVGDFNHYEGAIALMYGLPIFLLVERGGLEDRGIVSPGGGNVITYMPENPDLNWCDDPDFVTAFNAWKERIGERNDVFLSYCSTSAGTAAQIQLRLQGQGVSVHNWVTDFQYGTAVLSQIENARATCSCGIFIFGEDDNLIEGGTITPVPRDNVIFEAGYFMSSKGPDRCLVVLVGQARMPADLAGTIYVHLATGADVASIEGRLISFLQDI